MAPAVNHPTVHEIHLLVLKSYSLALFFHFGNSKDVIYFTKRLVSESRAGTHPSVPLIRLMVSELKGVLRSLMSHLCEGLWEILVQWDEMDKEKQAHFKEREE